MKSKSKLSITDIAEHFRVSVTTISFILNDKAEEKRVSASLTRRVKDYVKKVGYSPSSSKRKLHGEKVEVVAVFLPDFSNSSNLSLLEGLRLLLAEKGYAVLAYVLSDDAVKVESDLKVFFDQGIQLFVSLCQLSGELVDKFVRNDKVLIVLDGLAEVKCDTLVYDYKEASRMLVLSMLAKGYDRVGFVSSISSDFATKQKLQAYIEVLDESGGDLLMKKINQHLSKVEIVSQMKGFIEGNNLDAVFYTTEDLALIGQEVNLLLPRKVSLGTFSDSTILKMIDPNVDLVSRDNNLLVTELVDLLLLRTVDKKATFVRKQLSFVY